MNVFIALMTVGWFISWGMTAYECHRRKDEVLFWMALTETILGLFVLEEMFRGNFSFTK